MSHAALVIGCLLAYLVVGVVVCRYAIPRMDRPPADPLTAGVRVVGWPLIAVFTCLGVVLEVLGRLAGVGQPPRPEVRRLDQVSRSTEHTGWR